MNEWLVTGNCRPKAVRPVSSRLPFLFQEWKLARAALQKGFHLRQQGAVNPLTGGRHCWQHDAEKDKRATWATM